MTTIKTIKAQKTQPSDTARKPLVCLTAYTAPMAAIMAPHVDIILVGDSLGMVLYGMDSTRDVTLDIMINHGQAVRRGAPDTLIVVDMPFGTYEDSPAQALTNAQRIIAETTCDAVKLEGGVEMAETVRHLTQHNIPVMGHIGLMPQAVADGKFTVKGKTEDAAAALLKDAQAIEEAGAFAIVIEGTIEPVAAHITSAIAIPTIGIGASAACDGQILVTEDMIGLHEGHVPKFVKQYAQLHTDIAAAIEAYATDVRARAFPTAAQLYSAPKKDDTH